MHTYDVSAIVESYLETAIWADLRDDEGNEVDMFTEDFSAEAVATATAVVEAFLFAAAAPLAAADLEEGTIGHNLWLTAAGHGAGFWDMGLGAVGDELTTACRGLDAWIYLGDDGLLYLGK